MEFLEIESSLSNIRKAKEQKVEVITKPTKGNIAISALLATKLNVGIGDNVNIVKAKNGKLYIHKGYQDEKHRVGCKLGGKAGKDLVFSTATAYDEMGGNENTLRHFDVLDIDNADYNVGVQLPNGEKVLAYELVFSEEIQKQVRIKSEKSKTVTAESTVNTPVVDAANTALEVEEAEEDLEDFDL